MCSGFLVGPDTLVTAGHCYKSFSTPEEVCKKFSWVFDYGMISEKHDPTQNIPLQNIYLCKKVMLAELSQTMDFSIIKLDRVVLGREPLKFRTTGKVSHLSNLVVIGHPSGLPTKISSSAHVTRNSDTTKFSTNLDTFHGNSGSAVFDATTGLVEGILIQGKTDYTPKEKGNNKSCLVVNKCDELTQNCSHGVENGEIEWGEVVLRITQISTQITRAIQFQATPKSSLVKARK
jgi:V8-like Glu-specific endopeptidase